MKLQPEWAGDPGEVQTYGPGFIARSYLVERIVRELQPANLLDIGCGRGNITRLVARHAQRTVAAEISDGAARLAGDALSDQPVDVLAADVLALEGRREPPLRHQFDLVLLSEVLEHLDDDAGALERCYSLVRPGGRLLATVPAHPHLWTDMDVLIEHRRRYTRTELLSRMQRAGFDVEHIYTWGFPITGALAHRAQRLRARRLRSAAGNASSLNVPRRLRSVAAFVFGIAARLEQVFCRTDRGLGYAALARRREDPADSLDRAA